MKNQNEPWYESPVLKIVGMLAFFAFILFIIVPGLTLLSDPSGEKGNKYLEMFGLQSTHYNSSIPLDAINSPDYWKNQSRLEKEIKAMQESHLREMEKSNSQEKEIIRLSAELQSVLGIKHVEPGFSKAVGKKYVICSVGRPLANKDPMLVIFPGVSFLKTNRPFDGWYISPDQFGGVLPPDSVQNEVLAKLRKK